MIVILIFALDIVTMIVLRYLYLMAIPITYPRKVSSIKRHKRAARVGNELSPTRIAGNRASRILERLLSILIDNMFLDSCCFSLIFERLN